MRLWLRSIHIDVASGQNGREEEMFIFHVKIEEMLTLVNSG